MTVDADPMEQAPELRTPRTRHLPPPGLGADLRAAREALGWTPAYAAYRCGISRQYMLKLERDKGCPSVIVARGMVAVLGLQPDVADRLLAAAVPGVGHDR